MPAQVSGRCSSIRAQEHANLARVLRDRGALEEAERVFAEAAEVYEVARLRAGWGLARVTFEASPNPELAALRLRLGREEEAWPAVERSLGRVLAEAPGRGQAPRFSARSRVAWMSLRSRSASSRGRWPRSPNAARPRRWRRRAQSSDSGGGVERVGARDRGEAPGDRGSGIPVGARAGGAWCTQRARWMARCGGEARGVEGVGVCSRPGEPVVWVDLSAEGRGSASGRGAAV